MNAKKATEWIINGNVGISSKTMWAALMGVEYYRADFPHDAADFSRCHTFAEIAELTPEDFETICKVYPWWRIIYEIWPDMAKALEELRWGDIYDMINEPKRYARLMLEAHDLVEIHHGIWINKNKTNHNDNG